MPTEAIEFRVNDDTLSGDLFRPKGVLEPPLVVQAPVLIIAAERDSLIPFAATRRTAARIRSCQFEALPIGHFDLYDGPWFEKSVALQIDFLRR